MYFLLDIYIYIYIYIFVEHIVRRTLCTSQIISAGRRTDSVKIKTQLSVLMSRDHVYLIATKRFSTIVTN